jgi:plasmid maintenance system antidote protein VapI
MSADVSPIGKDHKVKIKELAEILGIKLQGITEIFSGRNQPTGEQVLVMLELMKTRR